MKISWLCSAVILVATAAFAQTPQVTPSPSSAPTAASMISMTGCVAGGTKSEPASLKNALVLPFGSPPLGPEPLPPDLTSPTAPSPAPVATSGSATQPQSGTVGTTGTVTGTAPAGSSASSVDGYRLSGVDMTSWLGKRVEITGTVVPKAPVPQAAGVESSDRVAAASMPEFRVMSVQPVTGPCPK